MANASIDVINAKGTKVTTLDLPAEVFDVQTNVPLIHQVVVAQRAAARQGTHNTLRRGEVSGAGRKPFKQKGTGRARQGSIRAPQFTGGGVVHGPVPRDYSQRTPKKMIAAALRGARLPIDPGWTRACRAWRGRYPVCLPEYASGRGPVNIYHFVERLSRRLTPRDIVVSDAGSAFYAVSQCVKLPQGARYITSGGFATMGYSVPAGIGACIAAGGGRVICITGDGSFQQNIQELQSIAHHSLPIKIFVLNNEGYLSIRFTQERYFEGRLIGEGPSSGVSFPDCRKIANAYGLRFVRVRATPGLDAGLDAALSCDGPVLCEIMSPPGQLIIPTVASRKLPDGRMVSRPLEDMYPFLDRARFRGEMFIPPVE